MTGISFCVRSGYNRIDCQILVPVDGTRLARPVLEYALEKLLDARLTLLYVVGRLKRTEGNEPPREPDRQKREREVSPGVDDGEQSVAALVQSDGLDGER